MKKLLKVFKYLGIIIIAIIITLNLYILLSGRFYLYKGIANTYLVGKIKPSIYDLKVFPYSTMEKSDVVRPILFHSQFNNFQISQDQEEYQQKIQSKGLLIFKNDSLLLEKFWGEHDNSTVSNSFSMAKTVVAMLIGIAKEEGDIKSLNDKVCEYLPEFCGNGKEKITIRHLLTMSSGLDWTESAKNPFSNNAESYYGEELRDLVLKQKVSSEPGKVFKYQSGNTQILAFILESATKRDLSEYAKEKIWDKIGTESDIYWNLDKENGDEKAFCCLYASAKDYARLGMVLLHKGNYNGQQIIPTDYYLDMVSPEPLTTKEKIPNYRYGLQTWTYMDDEVQVNYMRGVKGQYIITVPEEDLLIVRLGSHKEPDFELDETQLSDPLYFETNKFKVGHSTSFLEVLKLARSISDKTKVK